MADVTGEVTDLLQHLIRNACVNDGTPESGRESRSADLIEAYLAGSGVEVERAEAVPGRANLVARIEGRNPAAPSLLLLGHTDVVPVNPDGWQRDPFGGELVEGEVWGRGAVDMLNLTASMAVAVKHLARSGFRPEGTLLYAAVADEEALGTYGAAHLTTHLRDAVACDYVITESGGFVLPSPGGPKLPALVGEKGTHWCRLRVRGTPGHASQPLRTDNALVKAAEVVRRIAAYRPETRIHESWRRFVDAMELPDQLARPLLDPDGFWETVQALPMLGLARQAHACCHLTIAPTVVHGGTKTNVIPDRVELDLDIRTLPGQTAEEVEAVLAEIIGPDLAPSVEVVASHHDPASESPVDTPLWHILQRAVDALRPGGRVVPFMTAGATDARFFRRLGAVAYGFGLFSERISFDEFAAMFHGDNERVDVESLRLTTELWRHVATSLLAE